MPCRLFIPLFVSFFFSFYLFIKSKMSLFLTIFYFHPQDTKQVVETYKSGFEPPGDVEFEDYSVSMKRAVSESSFLNARGESRRRSRSKLWPLIKRNKVQEITPGVWVLWRCRSDVDPKPEAEWTICFVKGGENCKFSFNYWLLEQLNE